MPKAGFYAVARGHAPGVYSTWAECQQQTQGYSNSRYKKFNTQREADAFIRDNAPGPASRSSTSTSPSQRNATPAVAPTKPVIAVYPASAGPSSAPTFVAAPPTPSKKNKTSSGKKSKPKSPYEDVPPHEEHRWQIVYTDGACSNNGKGSAAAGVGVWFGPGDPRNICERCPGDQTNNRAELIGIIRALETIPPGDKPLLIKTDSAYSMKCVYDWLPKWERTNKFVTSTGKPVKNLALIQYLSKLLALRDVQCRGSVRLQHVAGHSNLPGNDGADALACDGRWLPPSYVSEDSWLEKTAQTEEEIQKLLASRFAQRAETGDVKPDVKSEEDVDPSTLPPDEEVNDDGPETTEDFPDDDEWIDDLDEDQLDLLDPPAKSEQEN